MGQHEIDRLNCGDPDWLSRCGVRLRVPGVGAARGAVLRHQPRCALRTVRAGERAPESAGSGRGAWRARGPTRPRKVRAVTTRACAPPRSNEELCGHA